MDHGTAYTLAAIAGLGVVTFATRCFFLLPARRIPLPGWLHRGLKVAPLAALVAVIVPEVVLSHGELISTWRDARLPAVAAATLWYLWRPGVMGPLVAGLALFVPARLWLGW
jgi:branched-subunit amino acid transport protein